MEAVQSKYFIEYCTDLSIAQVLHKYFVEYCTDLSVAQVLYNYFIEYCIEQKKLDCGELH